MGPGDRGDREAPRRQARTGAAAQDGPGRRRRRAARDRPPVAVAGRAHPRCADYAAWRPVKPVWQPGRHGSSGQCPVSVLVSFTPVRRRSPASACSCSRRPRTVVNAGERRAALLESVLGATPQEFESPIFRHADDRGDRQQRPIIARPPGLAYQFAGLSRYGWRVLCERAAPVQAFAVLELSYYDDRSAPSFPRNWLIHA